MQPSYWLRLLTKPGALESGLIGISAGRTGSGFRVDGSVQQKIELPANSAEWKFVDREHPPVIDRVRQGIVNFHPTAELSAPRVERLAAALERYRRQGVRLIGFAPPFSTEVYRELTTDPRHRNFFRAFERKLPEVFAQAGFPYYDASNLASLGLDDRYMFDGFHAAETFHLHLLQKMLVVFPEVGTMLPKAGRAADALLRSERTNYYYIGIGQAQSSKLP